MERRMSLALVMARPFSLIAHRVHISNIGSAARQMGSTNPVTGVRSHAEARSLRRRRRQISQRSLRLCVRFSRLVAARIVSDCPKSNGLGVSVAGVSRPSREGRQGFEENEVPG